MKRLIAIMVMIFAASFLVSPARAAGCDEDHPNHQAGFTCPILVEKDSDALFTGFFTHPGNAGNFSDEYSVSGVRDIFATPGEKIDGFNEDMMMKFDPRGGLDPLHGIGPEDIIVEASDGVIVRGMLEYQSAGNESGRRLTVGTIRNETSDNEFKTLFGSDPLEDGYIGNVSDMAPYDNELYPAAIRDPNRNFQYCAPSGGFPFYSDCTGEKLSAIGSGYEDVFIYGLKNHGDFLIGASYDSFVLNVKSEAGVKKDDTVTSMQGNTVDLPATYISPLAVFKKDEDAGRVKFLGYTSFESPSVKSSYASNSTIFDSYASLYSGLLGLAMLDSKNNNKGVTNNLNSFLQFDMTSPYLPMLANPIDLESGGKWLSALYLNPFIDLDNFILNPYGRPYLFPDNEYHTFLELLHTKVAGEANAYKPLEMSQEIKSYFPNGITTPVVIWAEGGKREVGEEEPGAADYEYWNPSNHFSPAVMGLVSPGSFPNIYDHAVLTDFPGENPRQSIVVASNKLFQAITTPINKIVGEIYVIDPGDASSQLWMKSWEIDANGYPKYYPGTTQPISIYTPMPVFVPKDVITVQPPPGNKNVVPYKITTVPDLAGKDGCQDILVTWRGAQTIYMDQGQKNVRFENGSGMMFADQFTIIHRAKSGTRTCKVMDNGIVYVGIPILISQSGRQVAAVAAGDFDADGKIDIVATNLSLEETEDSTQANKKYSSYAYVFSATPGGTYPIYGAPNYKRIRAGYRKFNSPQDGYGAGNVSSDGKALLFTNGLPLMLPPVSCQDHINPANPAVAGVFGTMSSVLYDLAGEPLGLDPAFAYEIDDDNHVPIPPYCAPRTETCTAMGVKFNMKVPLWKEDCLQENCPWADSYPEYCQDSCQAFYKLCTKDTTVNPPTIKRKPYVGFVDCSFLDLTCKGTHDCDYWLDHPDNVPDTCCQYYEEHPDKYEGKTLPPKCNIGYDSCKTDYFDKDKATVPGACCEFYPDYNAAPENKDYIAFNCCNTYANDPDKYDTMPPGCCNYYATKTFQDKGDKIPDQCCGYYTSMAYGYYNKDIPDACCEKGDYSYKNHKGCCKWLIENKKFDSSTYPDLNCTGPSSMIFDEKAFERDGTGGADSGGDTEFAAWRPDVVYSSNGHAIARADEVIPASGDGVDFADALSGVRATPTSLADYLLTESLFMMYFRFNALPPANSDQVPPSCSLADPGSLGGVSGAGVMPDQLEPQGQFDPGINLGQFAPSDSVDNGWLNNINIGDDFGSIFGFLKPSKPNYDKIRLPRGAVMPGEREMAAVIPYTPPPVVPTCGNNVLDGREECEYDASGTLLVKAGIENCVVCSVGCRCDTEPPACGNNKLDAGEDCDVVDGVFQHKPGMDKCVCATDCTCSFLPPEIVVPEEPKPEPPTIEAELPAAAPVEPGPIAAKVKCYLECDFTTNESAELHREMTRKYGPGIEGDLFCEPGTRANWYCYVQNGAYKAMDTGEYKIMPFMITQNSGSKFLEPEGLIPEIDIIRNVTRIIPLEGTGAGAQKIKFSLPDLSKSGDVFISGVVPFDASLVVHGTDGTTIVNNVLQHKASAIMPESLMQFGLSASEALAEDGAGSRGVLHHMTMIFPYDFPRDPTRESFQEHVVPNLQKLGMTVEDLYIENRMMDPEAVKAALDAGENTLPWVNNLNYQFTIVQEVATMADASEGDAAMPGTGSKAMALGSSFTGSSSFGDTKNDFYKTNALLIENVKFISGAQSGGRCACVISSAQKVDVRAFMPIILLILISSGAFALVRVRVKARQKRGR